MLNLRLHVFQRLLLLWCELDCLNSRWRRNWWHIDKWWHSIHQFWTNFWNNFTRCRIIALLTHDLTVDGRHNCRIWRFSLICLTTWQLNRRRTRFWLEIWSNSNFIFYRIRWLDFLQFATFRFLLFRSNIFIWNVILCFGTLVWINLSKKLTFNFHIKITRKKSLITCPDFIGTEFCTILLWSGIPVPCSMLLKWIWPWTRHCASCCGLMPLGTIKSRSMDPSAAVVDSGLSCVIWLFSVLREKSCWFGPTFGNSTIFGIFWFIKIVCAWWSFCSFRRSFGCCVNC